MRPTRLPLSSDDRRRDDESSRVAAALDAPLHRRRRRRSCRSRGSLARPATRRRSATPSMATIRSPGFRPAAAPAPPALTSPSTGSLHGLPRPMRCIVLASTSRADQRRRAPGGRAAGRGRRASLTSRSMSSPCSIACVTCQRRSVSERTSCHSPPSCDQARTQSPARMPAFSATLAADRRAEHRLRLVDADPVRRRVQRDREQRGWRAGRRRRSRRAARAACG